MAEKRMFTKQIIDTDAFLGMPLSAQALYFHLNMRADDDGFVANPKKLTQYVSASEDDLRLLLMKRFVIGFDSGVIVIKHWRMHNTLKNDRYKPTAYQEEFAQLGIKPNKAYTEKPKELPAEPARNQSGTGLEPQYSEGLGSDIGSEENSENDCADAQPCDTVLTLLLNDGSEYAISDAYINEMQACFPNVNVLNEMFKMKAWCINNPKKRKTKRGIKSFINSWLSKEQDRGGNNRYDPRPTQPARTSMDDLRELHARFSEEDKR